MKSANKQSNVVNKSHQQSADDGQVLTLGVRAARAEATRTARLAQGRQKIHRGRGALTVGPLNARLA